MDVESVVGVYVHLAHVKALVGRQVLIPRPRGLALLHLRLARQPGVFQGALRLLYHRLHHNKTHAVND